MSTRCRVRIAPAQCRAFEAAFETRSGLACAGGGLYGRGQPVPIEDRPEAPMNRPLCLVINPSARNGRVVAELPAIARALAAGGAAFRLCESTSLEHAKALATRAAAGGEIVVAVGGDGLVGALAGALARAGNEAGAGTEAEAGTKAGAGAGTEAGARAGRVLGLIPAGRGNDTARMLGIPADPVRAARNLLEGRARPVDLIGVRAADGAEQIVAGSVYMGVPSEGGEIANASRLTRGPTGYLLAGVRALLAWQPATFTVRVDGRAAAGTAATGEDAGGLPGFCVVVANSAFLAAGRKAVPAADVTDGLLDVLMVRQAHKATFARVMLRAGKGTHVTMRQVITDRGATVTLSASRAMAAAADGETLPCASPLGAGCALHIRALPAAIRVISPT
jgi:diacylglycerol kinase (ATP)